MGRRRAFLTIDDSVTKVGGYLVGEYPKGEFIYNHSYYGKHQWPLKVISLGSEQWIKGCVRYRINSCVLALEYVVTGRFLLQQNDKRYILNPGDMAIVHIGDSSEISTYRSGLATKKTLKLSGTVVPMLLKTIGLADCDVIKGVDEPLFSDRFDQIMQLCRDVPSGYMEECSVLAYELLLKLGQTTSSRYPEKLEQIISYFTRNIRNNLTIGDICRDFATSSASLHRLFRKHAAMSPIDFFLGMKIDTAKEMLVNLPGHSIKEIASGLGYTSQAYFSNEFKRRVGVSPKEFRSNPTTIQPP